MSDTAETTEDVREHFLKSFSDKEIVSRYAEEGPRRYVPGVDALHRMTSVLLAERAPENAKILVLGAGGGMELKVLAETHPGWSFVGVDPAAEMLRQAKTALGDNAGRAELLEGYIDDAPEGPFDGAVCLLTLHFLEADERLRTVKEIHRRLKPGAPFIAAHNTMPAEPASRKAAAARYVAYGVASGAEAETAQKYADGISAARSMLPAELDETILREAGFLDAELVFAAFSWRGWVAYA